MLDGGGRSSPTVSPARTCLGNKVKLLPFSIYPPGGEGPPMPYVNKHRAIKSGDPVFLATFMTAVLDAAGVVKSRPAKRRKGRPRSVRKSRYATHSLAKKPLRRSRQAGPTRETGPAAPKVWPNWPDPLDFQVVPADEAITRVNAAGYFMHTLNGHIYQIDPDGGVTAQRPGGFNNVFACRLARCDDGRLISAGIAWRRSRQRLEYRHIGYWPDNHGRPPQSFNLWRGWGVDPKQGDWSIIRDHILNVIADGDKGKASYILDWCAHMVQRPWEKPGVALVLKGKKGTGKTLITEILARALGNKNTLITADGKKLFAQFNWHLADKVLIGAEEAFFGCNREFNDKLKHLLTGNEMEVEQKFGHRMSMKSMHRMIMTTNHADVVEMSDDERRFFVCDVSDKSGVSILTLHPYGASPTVKTP